MNARQLAEVIVDQIVLHERRYFTVTWDGTVGDVAQGMCLHENRVILTGHRDTITRVGLVEQVVIGLLNQITTGVDDYRQHTSSVNNYAMRVGDWAGIAVDGFFSKSDWNSLYLTATKRV
jgi:hypothetical protein